jgi:hypothetical protein
MQRTVELHRRRHSLLWVRYHSTSQRDRKDERDAEKAADDIRQKPDTNH